MHDNLIAIVATEAKSTADANGGSIAERFKAAAEAVKNHWLVTNDDSRFRGAVCGVMESFGESSPEYQHIEKEVRMLNQVAAMITAGQAGLSVNIPEVEEGFKPTGLLKIWHEAKTGLRLSDSPPNCPAQGPIVDEE